MTLLPYCLSMFLSVLGADVVTADGSDTAEPTKPGSGRPVMTLQQIESDWLRQDQVRGLPVQHGAITPQEDAVGGCDGVRDGHFGFHTSREDSPWWQVDLGRLWPLDQVLIYNRCDAASDRAVRLTVLLSPDGTTWTEVYRHDGSRFGGMPDGRPLNVPLEGRKARYLRIQLPGVGILHLDEVEVYPVSNHRNVALANPATQSSASPWSKRSPVMAVQPATDPTPDVLARGFRLAQRLRQQGADVDRHVQQLKQVEQSWKSLSERASPDAQREVYLEARWAVRKLALADPLVDFDDLLFVKRVPTSFTHMSDQYYGWFSRPGGGLYVLEDFKSDQPRLRCLTNALPPGNIIRPDLSYDGTKVVFAFARFHAGVAEEKDKLDKSRIPEDAFYHLYEVNVDGTDLRRLTQGKYDDFDGRYLPNGDIVFLSTRRGQFIKCGASSAAQSLADALPDCYVRCGGGPERPVAIYTLHGMDGDGNNVRSISPFESFEWTPSIAHDGRILYARWDYVDREAMPYISLWSTSPDGRDTRAVYGNMTVNPHCIFEARSIPGSRKLVFTASGHHSITAGSLVLLDPDVGVDGATPLTRLTPEVPFPEIEAWPTTYYVNPYPLSEEHFLVAWSDQPLAAGWPKLNPPNALGLYLYDAFGNLNLIYRDPDISSMYPIPVRPRPKSQQRAAPSADDRPGAEGRMLLMDVYQGMPAVEPGTVHSLRLVGVPPKTHPTMNFPNLGLTHHDPGKFVLGTVPVEKDGSAFFRVPAGVSFFMQALDAQGRAVQSMRSAISVQPGETMTCVGCHESRTAAPPNQLSLAALRAPSKITAGPEGSWPLDFSVLVQPVLDKHCVRCHQPGAEAAKSDLTRDVAYKTLTTYGGSRSLHAQVCTSHRQGFSTANAGVAQLSDLDRLLQQGHYDVKLALDDRARLITWMDTYAQRTGSFSADQEHRLRQLRVEAAPLLAESR